MTSFKLVGATVLISAAFVTPAFAQAAIQEPGAYAFYHPGGDVLNSSRPANALAFARGDDINGLRMSVRRHRTAHAPTAKAY